MKPVVTRLYAVLVALTLVGLFAWVGADWYQRQQKALDQGRASLRQAAGWIADVTVRHAPLDGATLNRVFGSALGDRWKMVLLSSSDRGTEYYRGPRPAVPVDQAVPRWEAAPLSEVKVAIPVFRANGDPMTLEGIAEFYGRPEIFLLLKACGFTLLVLLVLTTVVVLLSARGESEPEPEEEHPQEPQEPLAFEPEAVGSESIGTIPVETDDEYWFDDNLTLEDLPPLEHQEPFTVPTASPAEPQPTTPGLEPESALLPALDAELLRGGDTRADVSLVLFSARGTTVSEEAWAAAVHEAFPHHEAFVYEDGAGVVLSGLSLEQALHAARKFVDASEARWGGVVHAGVAARTGRRMPAATLLAEAASARRRSLAGTVRVLGLKIDPDRYREHVASASA